MTLAPGIYRPGQPGYIAPGTPEWLQCITPSKVASILGVSRFESAYRLWHRMKGITEPEGPKDIFDVGHDWEPAAANRWKRHNPGWRISPGEVQFVATDITPDGSGFQSICTLDRRGSRGQHRRVVEFKTARHMEDWGDDFSDECPEDYAAQCMAQMMFTGWTEHPAQLLVLGPFFNDHIYEIPFDLGVAAWMFDQCSRFYTSLAGDEPPELDDSVATYECVREQHPDIDGSTAFLTVNQARDYYTACEAKSTAEKAERGAKTRLLDAMGDAQHAVVRLPGGAELPIAKRSPNGHGTVTLTRSKKTKLEDLELLHEIESRTA